MNKLQALMQQHLMWVVDEFFIKINHPVSIAFLLDFVQGYGVPENKSLLVYWNELKDVDKARKIRRAITHLIKRGKVSQFNAMKRIVYYGEDRAESKGGYIPMKLYTSKKLAPDVHIIPVYIEMKKFESKKQSSGQ